MYEQKRKKIDVIIPTWENEEMHNAAKASITANTAMDLRFYKFKDTTKNLGWIHCCNEGIRSSLNSKDSEYILLSNDDILVSPTSDWGTTMTGIMDKIPSIGALGPLTNQACGWSILNSQNACGSNIDFFKVPYISFFFVLIRKTAFNDIGILDERLPGGDDLDFCFRLNDKGFNVGVTTKVFVWHHYAQTGKKIYGDYWDSKEHTQKINKALIDKHGFKKYVYAISGFEEETNG